MKQIIWGLAVLISLVYAQIDQTNLTESTTESSTSTSTVSTISTTGAAGVNATTVAAAAAVTPAVAPISLFFGQVLRDEVFGLKKCKKPKDCLPGLRCDLLLNMCVPFNTPIMGDIEKPCVNGSECSPMHSCQAGFCRFCGPKSCRSSLDCCAGSFAQPGQPGRFYECLNLENLEKQSLAVQLGRPVFQALPGGKSPEDAIESDELIQLGVGAQGDPALYGNRCWARCNVDTDCHTPQMPELFKTKIACCNGACTRRQSCVNVPQAAIQLNQQRQQLAAQQLAQQQQFLGQQQAMASQQQAMTAQQQAQQKHQHGQHANAWGSHGNQMAPVQPAPVQFQQPSQQVPLSWAQAQQQQPQQQQQAPQLGGQGV